MMVALTAGAVALQLAWAVSCFARRHVEPLPGEAGRVQNPPVMILTGLGAYSLMCFVAAMLVGNGMPLAALVMALLATIPLLLLTAGCLPLIRYGREGFAVRSMLGRTREYRWQDVERQEKAGSVTRLVTARGSFYVDEAVFGRRAFVEYAEMMLKEKQA